MSTGDLTIGTEQTGALISYPELICINKNIEMMKVESEIISNERPTEFVWFMKQINTFILDVRLLTTIYHGSLKLLIMFTIWEIVMKQIFYYLFFLKGQDLIEEMKLMLEKEKVDDDLESLTILRKKYPKPTWI